MIRSWRIGFLLFAAVCILPNLLLADQVKALESSGIIQFADGSRVVLAGVTVPPESVRLLSVIVSGKEIEWEQESSKDYLKTADPKYAYLYVKTFEMDFPFTPGARPKETKVMINELLLSLGLARVDGDKEFKHREKFLKIESQARTQGQGIWSYEPIIKKKKP
jgi:endonuclease YncB( thermonuclease family)